MKQIQRLPDPQGMIARIKGRIPKNCAVRVSPYCEVIISMRMQGINFRKIEEWLIDQGPEHRIAASTICRNIKQSQIIVELSKVEEMAEQWGGRIDLDLLRELAGQIILQRKRVDILQTREEEKQQDSKYYMDKRIRHERALLVDMVKTLFSMMKTPLEVAVEAFEAAALFGPVQMDVNEDAMAVIRDLILSGELALAPSDEISVPNRN